MEMTDERRIPAPREAVWAALNDPAALRAAIPGCERFEAAGEDGYAARITAKVGPVKAGFDFDIRLSDLDPPAGCTISGEGRGGAAGFARGSATVRLREEEGETVLSYAVKAAVGGKLAQLGGRLIDGAARKIAGEFFDGFIAVVAERDGGAAGAEPAAAPAARRALWPWVAAALAALLLAGWLLAG